jgi:hypothetical protein
MVNYFYLDQFGIVHGTNDKKAAEKYGKVIASDVACGEVNNKGTFVGGFPTYKGEAGMLHQVFIYTVEQKVFIDENISTGHNVGIKDLPANIQKLARDFGYTQG